MTSTYTTLTQEYSEENLYKMIDKIITETR